MKLNINTEQYSRTQLLKTSTRAYIIFIKG
jgi:hypothetical protein